jgi:hypothetical protein
LRGSLKLTESLNKIANASKYFVNKNMFKGKNEALMHQSPIKERQLKSLSEDQKEILHEL